MAHEGGVERVGAGGELLVRAALDGRALVQHDDLVGAHLGLGLGLGLGSGLGLGLGSGLGSGLWLG